MNTVLFLSLTICTWTLAAAVLGVGSSTATTWDTSLSKKYQKRLLIHLVNNNWKPTGKNGNTLPGMLDHDEPLDEFKGRPFEAYRIFRMDITYPSTSMKLENALELLTEGGPSEAARYDSALDSIFICGGLMSNGRDGFADNLVKALAMRNILKNYNVFIFDLTGMSWPITLSIVKAFFGLTSNYKGVATAVGDFIVSAANINLMEINKIHLVGFCYSGQLIGYVARYLEHLKKVKVKSLLALDPFSLGLLSLRSSLSAEDAEVVHVYHTNSLVFGTFRRRGTADFVFNNGLWQPGCGVSARCSHSQSVFILLYVISFPRLFVARQCTSWFAFKRCYCRDKDTVELTFPPAPGAFGRFYIRTSEYLPFGLGEVGSECS